MRNLLLKTLVLSTLIVLAAGASACSTGTGQSKTVVLYGFREPLNNSAQAWMGRVVPFFGDVQASL